MLEVLARTESGLSATQIARLAGRGSRAGQRDVCNRLVEHGLVLADPANRGYLYRLNRSHVLADPLLAVARSRSTILDRLNGLHSAVDSSEPIVASWLDDSYTLLDRPITLLIKEWQAKPQHAVAGR